MNRLIAGGLAAVLLSGQAFAHTHLKFAVPADGSTVESAPKEFVLAFTEPSRITTLSIQKEGAAEQKLAVPPAAAVAEAKIVAPKLEDGRYVLNYRAVGADGHVTSGKVNFTIGGKAVAGAAPQADHGTHKH